MIPIRVNLHIDPAVAPWLYESLCELPRRQRAERIRILATLGLRLEGNPGGSGNGSAGHDSTIQLGEMAEDIRELVLKDDNEK